MSARAILWRSAAGVAVVAAVLAAVLMVAQERAWFEPAAPGGPATARLITAEQYVPTIHDLFGEDIEVEINSPPLQRRQGLKALGAATVVVTPGALERYDSVARKVAAQIVDENRRPLFVPCAPVSARAPDVACAETFFSQVGRFLYRRKLSEQELRIYVAAAGVAAEELGDFYTGLAYGLAGMLVSPHFLYFVERTEPDPGNPGQLRLDAYAKATRLSLFLWNAPPDEALLAAAEAGALHERRGLERQIERMLAAPRLEHGVRAFFADLLDFDKFFDALSKDPVIYPAFTPSIAISAKEQALRLIADHLLTRNGDYRDLFTTSRTFVDTAIGPFYKAPVPNPYTWVTHELDPEYSAGLLTSLAFLASHSHPGRSSPTLRGKALRELLLCQKVPEPPPNVNFEEFEDPSGQFKSARERLDAHSSDPVCAGCHKLTDPIGLALENFDGAGQFRLTENEAIIDPSGELDGHPFTDVAGIGRAVRDHPALAPCLASRLYAYGVGREVGTADRPWVAHIVKRFAVHGYRLPDLMREIANSRAFYAVSGEGESRDDNALSQSTVAAADIQ